MHRKLYISDVEFCTYIQLKTLKLLYTCEIYMFFIKVIYKQCLCTSKKKNNVALDKKEILFI